MVKVLIVRFSSIGDIVLTTPVIRAVKQQMNDGDVEVHYITKKSFASIIEPNPFVDRVWTIEKNVDEVAEQLRAEAFDYVFDLHNNLRSRKVSRAAGALTFRFNKLNLRKWWYVNTKMNVMPEVHIVERYMDTVRSFGIDYDGGGLDYFVEEKDDYSIEDVAFESGYLAWAIGGNHDGKKLPVDRMAKLASRMDLPIVLLGGPEDELAGEAIVEAAKSEHVINMCGKLRLGQSASVLSKATLVLCHDTGLMHIAAAFKLPVISIWGATVPEFGMYPFEPGEGSIMIEAHEGGRPYSKLGNKQWYKPPFKGLEKLDINEILAAVNKVWDRSVQSN